MDFVWTVITVHWTEWMAIQPQEDKWVTHSLTQEKEAKKNMDEQNTPADILETYSQKKQHIIHERKKVILMIDGQAKVNLMQVGLICLLTVIFIIKCFQYLWNLDGEREKKYFKDVLLLFLACKGQLRIIVRMLIRKRWIHDFGIR